MRLRSSQFVFLMLLICSVQVREEYAWHLADGTVTSRATSRATSPSQQRAAAAANSARRLTCLCLQLERLTPAMHLDAAASVAYRTPWTMPQPARESTAIASHTGFLRA